MKKLIIIKENHVTFYNKNISRKIDFGAVMDVSYSYIGVLRHEN